MVLNSLDTGCIPYDFFQWSIVDRNSPWGIGAIRMLIWLQRIITAAWRSMMDNAGDSSGANYVFGEGMEPLDNFWELTGKKGWKYTGDLDDVRKAFSQFQIKNNQQQLQAIIELALRFVDLETSTPTLFQGEAQTAPETLGATNIMLDANNISLRQRVKRYDDKVTKPHLTRYYDWCMQYVNDPEIKGDFNVNPRGVSVLLERDQQRQALLALLPLKGDPDFDRKTDWDKAIELIYKSSRLDILKDKETLKKEDAEQVNAQQAQEPVNPALQVAKVRADGDMQKETLRQESDMAELEFKAEQADLERQHKKEMKQLDLQIKMMEFAEKRNLKLDELKTQLAISGASMKNKGAVKAPQVTEPPTEPAGRAPEGEAFQK